MADRTRQVVWTEAARNDLDSVLEYIAEDSPQAAANLLDHFLRAAESLARLCERGRVVPELDDPAIRETFVHSYRILYEVADAEVRIVGVLHGARDFDRWLRGRETK